MRYNGANGMSALVKPVDSNPANTGHREPPGAEMHRAKIALDIP
jgi:hypothetical protein